jgi:hypothetical protein
MYEKYDAFVPGKGGGGGEYKPQTGFAWSNGVALILINDTYADYIIADSNGNNTDNTGVIIAVVLTVFFAFVIGVLAFLYFNPKYIPPACRKYIPANRSSNIPASAIAEPLTLPMAQAEVVNNPMV